MGTLKEELAKWKQSRYQKPMSIALAEVRERHDCSKVHPGKRHQEWMNTEPVKHVKEEMFDEGRMKDIYTLDSEGKSAQEIAKRLNLRVSTVKSILGENFETLHEFSDSQISQLKKEYEPLRGKTISGTNANKLMKIFDKFDKNKQLLIKILKANIPFVSMLAQARLISRHGANASQLAQMRKEELSEGKWKISGVTGYKNVGPQDRFEMIISATSKQDAERKWEKELDKHRAKRNIGPRGGGSIEDQDDIDIEPAGPKDNVGDISSHITQEYVPEAKAPFRLSYDDKYGKHAGFEDAKTLQDLQNKAQKLRAKGFKINKMGRNTSPVEQKLPEPEGKTEVPEAFAVQVTKMDGGKFIHGSYKTKAEAEKWIKWYKTGDVRQTKKIEVVKEDTGYLQSKMSPTQIANIKNVWKNKKATDVTDAVRQMIKRMDIPTQLAIKQADIPHISKLVETTDEELIEACWKGYTQVGMKEKDGRQVPNCVPNKDGDIPKQQKEDDDKAYAIGMAKAKEIKKDFGSPLKKSTIVKAHDIAKAIKRDEQVIGVGPKATFERLWLKHKRGDKAKK